MIVNVEALDLGLGSGGFDIVHANLTRGLHGERDADAHVMKLNYTSLQHAVTPVEDERLELPVGRPVAVLALHGQLAAVAWAFAQSSPGGRLGYVQTEGGALPGGHSRAVRALRGSGLLAGHLTAGAAFGGEGEAITTAGALHHGLRALGWDAAVCGPGPGIVGSSSALGHGGMSALDSAHAALALGCPTLLVARMSTSDDRERHRGISHHTLTVLDLLLEPVTVALPAGMRSPVGADLRAGLGAIFAGAAGAAAPLRLRRGRRHGGAPGARARRGAPGAHHAPRLASSDGRPAGVRGERPADGDDGPRPDAGPAVLRRGARGRRGAGGAGGAGRGGCGRRCGGLMRDRSFTALGGETVYDGRLVDVRVERFRHADGEEVTREIVRHGGAVAIVAYDEHVVHLVRQPREAVQEPDLLEIPAGRLDVEGESPARAAQRELAEEVGLAARSWEPIVTYYTGAGFTDERVHLFAARELYAHSADSGENERIEIVAWPLADLDGAIAECRDAKTLIGLMWLARRLNGGLQRQGGAAAEAKRGE